MCVRVFVGARKPFDSKPTVFAKVNFEPLRYRGFSNRLDCAGSRHKACEASLIFLLAPEKICCVFLRHQR